MKTPSILTLGLAATATGIALNAWAAPASSLSLDRYLDQVSRSHQGLRASEELSAGTALQSKESALLYSPSVFANATYYTDRKDPLNSFSPSETDATTYSLGIAQLTPFGTRAKVGYAFTHTQLEGVYPPIFPSNDYFDSGPTLEITQSLWRNGFGSETRATSRLLEASALASHFAESYRIKLILMDAELNYWRLALARETVNVATETLKSAEALHDWALRRARLQLGDKADLLQAEANFQLRKLELQSDVDEERASSRAFNSLRSIDSDVVTEALSKIEPEKFTETELPTRAELRDDTRAALQNQYAAQANAQIGTEKTRPSLDVFANIGLNGHDNTFSNAFSNSFNFSHRTATVGIQFSAPLEFGTSSDIRGGYTKESLGAESAYQRKYFEQENEWKDLMAKLDEAQKRLKLSGTLVKTQHAKLDNEKERLRKGRTTTYQVLLFEQDYLLAQLNQIRAQADVLQLIAQLKTFRGTPS